MSAYTHKNLKEDVTDMAPQFGMSPQVEARFGRDDLECEKGGVSYERFAPGERAPFGHTHKQQEEVYVVVSGAGRVKLDDEIRDVRQWDAVRVSPSTMRAFEAGPDGLELIAFGAPNTGPGDGDIVMGWWEGD
jgi:mannose-6-phosphate isomerase-like protein (cupin superfamily)